MKGTNSIAFATNKAFQWFNKMCCISTHPALGRRGGVLTTPLCTYQRRRRYVPNETPNDVSMRRHQDVSVVRLCDILLGRHNKFSKGRNNNVPSARLHNVSNKSQMKHPTTSQWYVTKTSNGTYPRRPISTSLLGLL